MTTTGITKLADAVKGSRLPAQTIEWVRDEYDTSQSKWVEKSVDLTGATISARIIKSGSTARDSDGTFTLVDASAGKFKWEYGENDVKNEGRHSVVFIATYSATPLLPAKTFRSPWIVREDI